MCLVVVVLSCFVYVLYIQLIVAEFITINLQRRTHEKKIKDATFKNAWVDGNIIGLVR